MRGCSMLLTTYAVGELSALNGVMGAKAERSCVFHVVGMPTMRNQRVRKIIHHTLGDGEFQNFANISAQAACVSEVITPDNCVHEMERLIATARAESRPAYILVASDYAVTPVTGSAPAPYPKPASGPDLAKAVAAIAERIDVDHVRIGDRIYNPVRLGDVFEMLARSVRKNFGYSAPPRETAAKPGGKPSDPITAAALYPRYRDFLKPSDQIVIESGSSTSGIVPLPLPDGAEVHSQTLWGSIGWATGATLGIALADRSRRTVLFTGEGSHQLTANDVGTMGRNGLKPIIFVLNNEGYMVERALEADPDWVYNDLAPWNYHALPAALGCRDWFTARVTTLGELDAALARATTGDTASYIEVVGDRMDLPAGLAMAHQRLDSLYGSD